MSEKKNLSLGAVNLIHLINSECLASPPILPIYDPKLVTKLHCDASSRGFGAVLLQKKSATGFFQLISYFSQKTTRTEASYHSFDLECRATIYAIKHFHIYLYGIEFTLITDCAFTNSTEEEIY